MIQPRTIVSDKRMELTIDRLCFELIEAHGDFSETCLIGIQSKGAVLANRLSSRLKKLGKIKQDIPFGKLDVTFYRDDFRLRTKPLKAFPTEIDFLIEGKKVVLVDDVLYTGRTISAALAAMQHYGRPANVELVCLVDRRYSRHLPISANYIGVHIDALDEAYVKVSLLENDGQDKIELYAKKQ